MARPGRYGPTRSIQVTGGLIRQRGTHSALLRRSPGAQHGHGRSGEVSRRERGRHAGADRPRLAAGPEALDRPNPRYDEAAPTRGKTSPPRTSRCPTTSWLNSQKRRRGSRSRELVTPTSSRPRPTSNLPNAAVESKWLRRRHLNRSRVERHLGTHYSRPRARQSHWQPTGKTEPYLREQRRTGAGVADLTQRRLQVPRLDLSGLFCLTRGAVS